MSHTGAFIWPFAVAFDGTTDRRGAIRSPLHGDGGNAREKLRLAQDLPGHAVPSGDLAQVVDRALTVLIEALVRRKFAATPHPRGPRGQAKESDDIPACVRRAAFVKDGGRCSFVSKEGHRCGERRFIEFHHVIPRAAGGKTTVENLRLRCRAGDDDRAVGKRPKQSSWDEYSSGDRHFRRCRGSQRALTTGHFVTGERRPPG